MAPFPFSIVGFDLDGTLVDTRADLTHATNHALALIGRPPLAVEAVTTMIGRGTRHMLAQALAATGDSVPLKLERLHGALVAHYAQNIARSSRPYPGAAMALDALRTRGVRLGLVTNKLEQLAVKLVGELGLDQYFECVVGGDTLGPGKAKPSPAPVLEMMRRLGGGRAAFVGDSIHDAQAAHGAGLPFVAVRFGFAPPDTLACDAAIEEFGELMPALERLGTGVSAGALRQRSSGD